MPHTFWTPLGLLEGAEAARVAIAVAKPRAEPRPLIVATNPQERPHDAPPLALVEEACRGAAAALTAFAEGRIAAARSAWGRVGRVLRYGPALRAKGVLRYITHDLGDGQGARAQTISVWARELGWKPQSLTYRIAHMPLHEAMIARAAAPAIRPPEQPPAPTREEVLGALRRADGNLRRAGAELGVCKQRVAQMIERYGLQEEARKLRAVRGAA